MKGRCFNIDMFKSFNRSKKKTNIRTHTYTHIHTHTHTHTYTPYTSTQRRKDTHYNKNTFAHTDTNYVIRIGGIVFVKMIQVVGYYRLLGSPREN